MNTILQKAAPALLLVACCQWHFAHGQVTGGQQVFRFMTLSTSARATALGAQIAVRDEDLSLAASNPSALNPLMDGRLVFQHNFFLTDIQHGYAAYAQNLPKLGFTLQAGLQYMNYGDIKRADEYGNITGKVTASETAFTLGGARALTDRISLGLNVRLGLSTLDTYKASALAADAGLMYADTASRFAITAVVRNAGAQLSAYNDLKEYLPFDLQIGVSKKLKYLPFRISVIAHHLHRWNIRYNDPNLKEDDILQIGDSGSSADKGNNGVDNFFRHLIFNGEFLLGRNEAFQVRFGYDHLRKKELSVRNYRSLAGFSGGVGVKIKRFRFDVGYAAYHLAGGVIHLGIGTNLKDFF